MQEQSLGGFLIITLMFCFFLYYTLFYKSRNDLVESRRTQHSQILPIVVSQKQEWSLHWSQLAKLYFYEVFQMA